MTQNTAIHGLKLSHEDKPNMNTQIHDQEEEIPTIINYEDDVCDQEEIPGSGVLIQIPESGLIIQQNLPW